MNRCLLLIRSVSFFFAGALYATTALADSTDTANLAIADILRNFRFITSRSTVEVSGGLPTFSYDLNIAGKFGLVTGYDGLETPSPSPIASPPTVSGHASFINVKGLLFNPKSASPLPGLDLDATLNLSGLKGTFRVPSDIHFTGDDGQGIPMQLEAVSRGPLLHITGATLPVPTCASCGINMYKIDAYAFQGPFADFNLDGSVNRKDLQILMSNRGMQSGATFEQGDANGDGAVDGADFLLWQRNLGATTSLSAFSDLSASGTSVPEPATFSLILVVAALVGLPVRKRYDF